MRKTQRLFVFALTLFVMLAQFGCATSRLYSGDPLPPDQIAILERGDLAQILRRVDERTSTNFFLTSKKLEILPGRHTIAVAYGDGRRKAAPYLITFTAKAGVRYVIKSNAEKKRWQPTVVEKSSGIVVNETPTNLIPMYGLPNIEKPPSQKRADEQFIEAVTKESGSRREAAIGFASWGWSEYKKGDLDNAMRRFNQSWLLDPNYYQSFWGFGAVLLEQDKAVDALSHFDKALALIGDDKEKQRPRLLVDTARAYASQANKTGNTGNDNSDNLYAKATNLIEEALAADPTYEKAYRVGALIFFKQRDYKSAWATIKKARTSFNYQFDPDFLKALSKEMPEPD